MDIIVGTAGHIDHGKTALVKALTGVDADRLPEEKERGITIDLGFAELALGDVKIGFVDVPGHEKFIKNMLAGASGIDLVLLVVAADEGVMPQTREHFEICRLLGIEHGLIVLTKCDLVDEEFLELVKIDVADLVEGSFLHDAPVISVSSKTGDGIDALKNVLSQRSIEIPTRLSEFVTRLPVDRTFSVKGFGPVVTGTLASGEIEAGSEKVLLPQGHKVRVRGVQTHGKDVRRAAAGQRTAVNLVGVANEDIERGMVLCEPDALSPTQIVDAEVEILKSSSRSLKTRQRVRVHIGTVEALARIQVLNEKQEIIPGGKDFVQIRLENPVVAIPFERFILRQYSPLITIGGGKILDSHALKRPVKEIQVSREYFESLKAAQRKRDKSRILRLYLARSRIGVLTFSDLQARTGWTSDVIRKALDEYIDQKAIIDSDGYYVARSRFDQLKGSVLSEIENYHKQEPLSEGILRETLRERIASSFPVEVFREILLRLEDEEKALAQKDIVKSFSHRHELSVDENSVKDDLVQLYIDSSLQVPTLADALDSTTKNTDVSPDQARKVFQLLLNSGELVKINEDLFFSQPAIQTLVEKLKEFANDVAENRLIDVAEFKNLAGVSRKYAIPLLEYLDAEKITRRAGNKRLIL